MVRNGTIAALLVAFAAAVLVSPCLAQEEKEDREAKKQAEKEAKEKVKAFKATLKKAKTEGDFVTALEELGGTQHSIILTELSKWLGHRSAEVRQEAARQIAKYEGDPKAADALYKFVARERDENVAVKFMECIGEIACRKNAKKLIAHFKNKVLGVAGAAVEAAGSIKSKDLIGPLISLLKELESINDDPAAPGGPPLPGPSPGPGGDDEQRKRKQQLEPLVRNALKEITGERFNKGVDWERWWQKNKKDFKEPEK